MARQRRYSNEDVARTLAVVDAHEGNKAAACRETGLPYMTVSHWDSNRSRPLHPDHQTCEEQRRALDAKYEAEAHASLDLAADKRSEASYLQLMTGAGIATDKMRVLRELPDHITGTSGPATLEERNALLLELLTEALQRIQQNQPPAPALDAVTADQTEGQAPTLNGSFLPDVSEDP